MKKSSIGIFLLVTPSLQVPLTGAHVLPWCSGTIHFNIWLKYSLALLLVRCRKIGLANCRYPFSLLITARWYTFQHRTLHSAHIILHTTHCPLHTVQPSLNTSDCTLQTAYYKLLTRQCSGHTENYKLFTSCYTFSKIFNTYLSCCLFPSKYFLYISGMALSLGDKINTSQKRLDQGKIRKPILCQFISL